MPRQRSLTHDNAPTLRLLLSATTDMQGHVWKVRVPFEALEFDDRPGEPCRPFNVRGLSFDAPAGVTRFFWSTWRNADPDEVRDSVVAGVELRFECAADCEAFEDVPVTLFLDGPAIDAVAAIDDNSLTFPVFTPNPGPFTISDAAGGAVDVNVQDLGEIGSGGGEGGAPAAHAATHAVGGSDPVSPASIGAAQDDAVVHLTGDETIDGTKEFSDSPEVPDPTSDAHAANMGWVQAQLALAGGSDAPAVADLTELAAVAAVDREDRQLRLVVDANYLWRFSADSTATADTDKVVVPDDVTPPDPGRWIKLLASGGDHNSLSGLQGGAVGQYYHLTSAQRSAAAGTGVPSAGNRFVTADTLTAHTGNTANPHNVTKAQVGLSNVTNDAQLKVSGNLSDVTNPASARHNLGLGNSATRNVGTTAGTVMAGDDPSRNNARTPTAHADTHKLGGSDPIRLDELAAPVDNTTLNATTGHHGLLAKLSGNITEAFRGNGTWGEFLATLLPASAGRFLRGHGAPSTGTVWGDDSFYFNDNRAFDPDLTDFTDSTALNPPDVMELVKIDSTIGQTEADGGFAWTFSNQAAVRSVGMYMFGDIILRLRRALWLKDTTEPGTVTNLLYSVGGAIKWAGKVLARWSGAVPSAAGLTGVGADGLLTDGGSVGATDNAVLRADVGASGRVQSSGFKLLDNNSMHLPAISTPANPATGWLAFYFKTGSGPAVLDSSGTETVLGAGGGGGGGVTAFTDLSDVPHDYTGEAGRFTAVKGDASGLEFVDAPAALPAGGTTGQALVKVSDADGDAEWADPAAGVTVAEADGSPSVSDVTTIKFDGATVTDNEDGSVTVGVGGDATSIQGTPVEDVAPIAGQVMTYNGTQWLPANVATLGDSDYDSVLFLLHFDGTNGSTAFPDNGPSARTITATGSAALSTTAKKFGSASLRLESGSGNYVSLADSSDLEFGSEDFTVEGWYRFDANDIGYQPLFSKPGSGDHHGIALTIEADNQISAYITTDGGTSWNVVCDSSYTPSVDTWIHVALVRNGGTLLLFADGTQIASTSISGSIEDTGSGFRIGNYPYYPGGALSFSGYVDEFRVTLGVARYVSDFAAPTEAFFNQLPGPSEIGGSFTVSTVPNPSGRAGQTIYVSDGDDGAPCGAMSDGTDWLRITLGSAISP